MQALFVLLGELRRETEARLDELHDLIEATDGAAQGEFQDRWFQTNLERRRLDPFNRCSSARGRSTGASTSM